MSKPHVILVSAGAKRGVPPADCYIDARCLKDFSLSGEHPEAQAKLAMQDLDHFWAYLRQHLASIPSRRRNGSSSHDPYLRPFIVCIFCAHGINRSPALKHWLARKLQASGLAAYVEILPSWREGDAAIIDQVGKGKIASSLTSASLSHHGDYVNGDYPETGKVW